jgi:hypothetical protein
MYQFSRAIYRELAPYVLEERPSSQIETNKELVLRACEATMQRLLHDSRYFARPARSLFNDIRVHFSVRDQMRVYLAIERHVARAAEYVAALPLEELTANGVSRECQAMTRKGRPCQRQPVPNSEYCPSHQHLCEHLEELAELELVAA